MKIIIFEKDDSIDIHNNTVTIRLCGKVLAYPLSEIDKITVIMNDIMDNRYDMSVMIKIGESVFVITSDYENFEEILFTDIAMSLQVDMVNLTKAMSCIESGEFIIYKR